MTPAPTYPGEQYTPSNGDEGHAFISKWCERCERDKVVNGTCHAEGRTPGDDDWCPIVGASFRGEAVEWRRLETGGTTCMAFVPLGEPIPAPRCGHTQDLFGESA